MPRAVVFLQRGELGTAADGADANRPPQSAPEKAGAPGWRARL